LEIIQADKQITQRMPNTTATEYTQLAQIFDTTLFVKQD